ncbi:AraC family transcriptional regulator [Lacticaseibacillus mingshuiensis]|uniref:Helix-turn-helix domain-containing protein n=1 Tax=Lacticaseibacillus mingshuiensis TaxID=2799574 RepID=A0ABW4CEI3_9LACO|nr:AraC family transcriptional regulator [Lacticaseibacillus mingshuiensis]
MSTFIEIPVWSEPLPFRYFENDGGGPVFPHRHKEIEIIQAVQNQTRIGVGDRMYTLEAGDIFFFAGGQPHYFLPSPNSLRNVFQFDIAIFDVQLMQTSLSGINETMLHRPPCSQDWPKPVAAEVTRILAALRQAAGDGGLRATIIGNLYLLLDCFVHRLPELKDVPAHSADPNILRAQTVTRQLNLIYDYINDHYFEPISLPAIAGLVGFNPQYFARFFKRNTGSTFGRFLLNYRVMKACFELTESDDPMPDIAERCGFGSVKTFHHEFKREMQTSPLEYRKRMRKEGTG